jgi:dTMP kinase
VGQRLREILLDPRTGALSPRTETLLYGADKAEHLAQVVRPALARGAIVITDRYVDSTLAYQGAGRDLGLDDVEQIARWSTGDLRPHLTVLLDLPPDIGRSRFEVADRLESEPASFHQRVRTAFLTLAAADTDHYLVLDARLPPAELAEHIRSRVQPLLALAGRTAERGAEGHLRWRRSSASRAAVAEEAPDRMVQR